MSATLAARILLAATVAFWVGWLARVWWRGAGRGGEGWRE